MKSSIASTALLAAMLAAFPAFAQRQTIDVTCVQFTSFEADQNGVIAMMRLPKQARGAVVYAGPYDEARALGLENLRQALEALEAELEAETAPLEVVGMPPTRVRNGRSGSYTYKQVTTVNRSKRDIEDKERRAAERANRLIEGYAKTLDVRATPSTSGKAICGPVGPGKLVVCAFARLPDASKSRNVSPTRFVYWWGIVDCPENGGVATVMDESNATDWRDIFP